jgi:hypothetical protein
MYQLFSWIVPIVQAAQDPINNLPAPSGIQPIPFTSSVGLNLVGCGAGGSNIPDGGFLGCYISSLYTFFVQGAIVLAVVMVMFGGFQWLLATGNSSKISEAKSTISAAIFGLILALTSYLLFAQVNTKLVNLQTLDITPVHLDAPTAPESRVPSVSSIHTGERNSKDLKLMHPDLLAAFEKLDSRVPTLWVITLNSVTDDRIFSGDCRRDVDSGPLIGCQHKGSGQYHYGGPNNKWAFNQTNPPISCAVDLGVPSYVGGNAIYAQLEPYVVASGFTGHQCEESCWGSGSRCNDVLDCATGKDIDPDYTGPTRYGKIGHLHAQITNCSAISRTTADTSGFTE